MTTHPVDQLAQALDVAGDLVAAVRDEQWGDPTPCADWTVRDLVNHLVGGHQLFTAILHGDPIPPLTELHRRHGDDLLGDDPAAAFRASADALVAAFRQPGVLDQVVTVPFGSVPGIGALHLRLVEALVHGWDLARATGRSPGFPEALAEQELTFSRAKLADLPPGRTPFAPPRPTAGDAPAIDRLAALLGRDTGTASDPGV
jgi:uncharacterized protein (TIGR03086 family)